LSARVRCLPQLQLFLCVLLAIAPALAQKTTVRPPLPVDEWLSGPDRQDFPWKVKVLPPMLTFQQRYLEQIRVTISAKPWTEGASPDLHFVVRVSDEGGHWFKEDNYTQLSLPKSLDMQNEIQFGVGIYLKPG